MGDQLTSVPNVKIWLNTSVPSDADPLLTRLISSASAFFLRCCNRPSLLQATFTEQYSGTDSDRLVLRNTPVQSVSALTIGTLAVPAIGPSSIFGYFLNAWGVQTFAYRFRRGVGNISVTYVAGYATVPADVEQAVIELVANKYKRKDHIGVNTEHTGSEVTVSYQGSDLTAEIKRTISNYRNVTVMF